MNRVIIIGGGLAGLITAIDLAQRNIGSLVLEKYTYPFHKVCGEYVSNEVMPYLKTLGIFPETKTLPQINRFQLSSTAGKTVFLPLDLGGFGISRYAFDYHLYQKALDHGVEIVEGLQASHVQFVDGIFRVQAGARQWESDIVVGAYGKRSSIDLKLNRSFAKSRSPYMAVKYHMHVPFEQDLIALHNFKGGYCGISCVEDGITNLCYLVHRKYVRQFGNISAFEDHVVRKNPLLDKVFSSATFLFKKPLTINEISFRTKGPLENHILMTGDTAGMITPLCGNGMANAIRSAQLVSTCIGAYFNDPSKNRDQMEKKYVGLWSREFKNRLAFGRQIQQLFGNHLSSRIAIEMALHCRPIAHYLVRNSHGKPF